MSSKVLAQDPEDGSEGALNKGYAGAPRAGAGERSEPSPLDEMDAMLRHLPVPIAIVDPSRRRLTAVNAPFAHMIEVDVTTASGMDLDDLIAVDRRHHAERVLAEVATGAIDFCQLRVRLLKRGGDELDVEAWIGALNAAPPVVGAVLAAVPRPDRYRPGETRLLRPDGHHVVLGTVGPDLRFTELSAGAPELFGRDSQRLRGECLADAVHPADVAELLLAVGRSAAEHGAVTARLRFGHSDGWVAVRCTISPVGGRVARFYVVMTMLPPTDEVEPPGDRLRRLEGHLSRIASEVQAAGVRSPVRDPVLTEAARRGLTARQTDVLRRVVHGVARGEPTSDIASQLLVSESTVRNHLAAVCRKFGVRSKSQLLAHLAALAQEPAS